MNYKIGELPLSNSFQTLGETFFSRVQPTPFETKTELVHFNPSAARLLNLHPQAHKHANFVETFSGSGRLPGSDPIAMLYAGHQFGHFVPQLGDGRAIVLGETTNQENQKWEIQLKGSGLTPYSRDGDGRAVLRSSIREYLCGEAMHALGIPTTRALCIIGSEDEVYREKIEPGAMLTRLAPSHVRFGSFEVFFYRNQHREVRQLADYVIEHHFPELTELEKPHERYLAWLEIVIDRTAALIACWQAVGFCHGVMNSDNMSVLGLTIDYGPFGFMEAFDPGYVCNHSDHHGRYAYDQQPWIGLFNLSCFAQAILPLLHSEPDEAAEIARSKLESYQTRFHGHYLDRFRGKLGLQQEEQADESLISDLLELMASDRVDFTILFRRLCHFAVADREIGSQVRDLFMQRDRFDKWLYRYERRLQHEASNDTQRAIRMKRVNPKYILRNYMAEIAIRKAEQDKDYSEVSRLFELLQRPYDEQPDNEEYAGFPPDWADTLTVSCSS